MNILEKLEATPFGRALKQALMKFPIVYISNFTASSNSGYSLFKTAICFSHPNFNEVVMFKPWYYGSGFHHHCSKCFCPLAENQECCSSKTYSTNISDALKYIVNLGLEVNNYTITFKLPEMRTFKARETRNSIFKAFNEGDWQINEFTVWSDMMIKCGGKYFSGRQNFKNEPIIVDFNVAEYLNLVYYDTTNVSDIIALYRACDYFLDDRHKDWCVNWIIEKKDYMAVRELNLV